MKNLEQGDLRYWRVSPSEQEGYGRNYSITTAEGDHIGVDFNYARRMVRIALSVASENGREYVSVIKNGTILQERELAGKRAVDLTSRMASVAPHFHFLPDDMVLQALGGQYGFPSQPVERRPQWRKIYPIYRLKKDLHPLRMLRRYLLRKRERELNVRENAGIIYRFFRRIPSELFDLGLGLALYAAFALSFLNLTELAGYLGLLAIVSGGWDWLWRQRDPFLPKVTALMTASAYAVFVQLQYGMWAIFL